MLMNHFSLIVRGSHAFFKRRLQTYPVGMSEQLVMMYLIQVSTANQDNVARHYKLDKGTIAKTIAKLEKKGFINRRQNKRNRRENLISLTETGHKLMNDIQNLVSQWEQSAFEGITEEEKEQFIQTLSKISMNVEEIVKEK